MKLCATTLALMLLGAVTCHAEVLLSDDFNTYNEHLWGTQPGDITLVDGKVLIKPMPGQAQAHLISVKKYKSVCLETRLKFNTLSSDSTIFYYLGFQNVVPWAENTCSLIVQDTSMAAGVKRSGQDGVRESVASVEPGKWYTLKIDWQPGRVEFFLDGKSIFKTDKADAIPQDGLPIFLGANTLNQSANKPGASLEIDYVRVNGEQATVKKTAAKSENKALAKFARQIGDPNGSTIKVSGDSIHLENSNFICELGIGSGVQWNRLYNKATEEECLSANNNSTLFKIIGKHFSLSSGDFDINDIRLSQGGQKNLLEVVLQNAKNNIECTLSAQMDNSQEMLWSLSTKNNSKQKAKIQPIFPVMSDIAIAQNAADTEYFFPWRTGIVGKANCDLLYEYGEVAWMQIVSVFNHESQTGMYIYPKDSSGTIKGMIFKKTAPNSDGMVQQSEIIAQYEVPKEDAFELQEGVGLAYYYFEQELNSGETMTLPPTVLAVYRGTWKEPLQRYSAWAHTWYKHVDTPQWFMNCFNFIPQHPPAYYSAEKKKYVAAERLAGSEHIVQWFAWEDYKDLPELSDAGQLAKYQPGDFQYNRIRGGLTAFNEEIKRMQANGTRVTAYIDHRFCCKDTKIGQAKGEQWAAIYKPGGAPEGYTGPTDQYVACYMEPNAWPHYLAQVCGRIIKDTGMDGIYLDELTLPFPCYNPAHIHNKKYKSSVYLPAFTANMTEARNAMRKENPQAILMTEHAGSDYLSQFIDGSWSETFYHSGFPFVEKYYDDLSLVYFHFCFPEFKLAEWGDGTDNPHRCFFNGIGIDSNRGVGSIDYLGKTGQVLKENGDAFATLNPEPLVDTKVDRVLANKFSIPLKTVYTLYNKSGKVVNKEIIEVEPRPNYHWVEMLYDNNVAVRDELVKSKDVLSLKIDANEVVCVGQLPIIINAAVTGEQVTIKLAKNVPNATLLAYFGEDKSQLNNKGATKVDIQNGQGTLACGQKGKVILKLMNGDMLIDEVILNVNN